MSNTYQIRKVTVTVPPMGMVGTDAAGSVVKKGDKCLINICAVKPDWREKKIFEGLIVGHIECEGYSEHHFNRTQKVMIPAGHNLVALMLDERGSPKSWDSLPVHISDGCIGSPVDELDGIKDLPLYRVSSDFATREKIAAALDFVLSRHYEQFGNAEREKTAVVFMNRRWVAIQGDFTPDEIRDAVEYIKLNRVSQKIKESMEDISPFAVKDGQVYINNAFIGNALSFAVHNREKQLEAEQSVVVDENSQEALTTGLQQAIEEVVSNAIRNALKPGGQLWNNQRAR